MKRGGDFSLTVIRIVIVCWLVGWIIKAHFFLGYLFDETFRYPIFNDFFPGFLQSPPVSLWAYALPVICIPVLFSNSRRNYLLYAALITGCSVILNLHLNTCNDATFVSSTWTGLWLIVFAWHLDRMDAATFRHLKMLGLCVIGLFFLGGTVGKITPEFTSGQTLYKIFFEVRPYWPHTWIRAELSIDQQKMLAAGIATLILLFEGLLALAPLFSSIVTLVILSMTLIVMIMFCTYNILSVNSCLIGICVACVLMERALRTPAQPDRRAET